MIQNYVPLIHGLIDAFLFLENASDSELKQSSAVRCMEHMASSLLKLSPSDQVALRHELKNIADASEDPSYKKFVRALPDMIDLSSE